MANNKEQERALERIIKLLKEEENTLKNIAALEDQIDKKRQKQAENSEAFKIAQKEVEELTRAEITAIEEATIKQQERVRLEEDYLKDLQKELKLRNDIAIKLKNGTEEEKKFIKEREKELGLDDESIKNFEKKITLQEKELSNQKKQNAALLIAQANIEDIGSLLGLASDVNQTWLGRLQLTLKAADNIGKTIGNYWKAFKTTFSFANIFASTVEKISESTIKVAFEMDSMLANFNKATGAGGRFNDVIDDVRFGSLAAGIGLNESAGAVQALFQNMRGFTDLNKTSQKEVAKTTALLDRMGISSTTTAQTLDLLTKGFRMSVTEALNTQKELASVATNLGLSPQKLAEDFVSTLPSLSQYGKQATSIFKELAAQSKETGVEISSLVSIAQQFDTFEGAANAAGKLNAILGGGLLNSVDLLNASEGERIRLLREGVQASGRSFDSLSKFEKMAVANAAGIRDMAEASRIFGATDEEFYRVQQAQQSEAMSVAALTQNAQHATSAQEKMKLATEALSGAALPLVEGINSILNVFLKINDLFGGALAPVLFIITGAFFGLSSIITRLNAITTIFTGKTLGQITATQAQSVAQAENTVVEEAGIITKIKGIGTLVLQQAQIIKNIAIQKAQTAGIWLTNIAEKALIFMRNLSIGTLIAGTVATVASTAARLAESAAVWAVFAAMTAWNALTKIATGLQWAMNVALSANPVGLVVIGITALIAALAALVIYYDEINNWIQTTTNGFFDFYDILALVLGPIGLIIVAGRKLIQNWDAVVETLTNFTNWYLDLFGLDINKVINVLLAPINSAIDGVNLLVQGLNLVSGADIPLIPKFADGITNFKGGMAIVGEKGPELVSLPPGSNVVTNENTQKIVNASNKSSETINNQNINNQNQVNQTNTNKQQTTPEPKIIKLMIDERELGRVIVDQLNNVLNLKTVSN